MIITQLPRRLSLLELVDYSIWQVVVPKIPILAIVYIRQKVRTRSVPLQALGDTPQLSNV